MSHTRNSNHQTGFEIAIVGMSGRFPGAENIHAFWQNLRNGVESISFFSDEELLAEGIDNETLKHPNYVKAKGVLENIELFDAPFFGFTPREAQIMDPQHRLFLQCAWEALENAGYDAEKYAGAIGVYASVSMNYYLQNNLYSNRELLEKVGELQKVLSSDKDFLSTRVSYKMNLKGPAVVVQSACSSSLVSTHLACQALLSGECDMTLAGGVSAVVPQKAGYFYQEEGIASPDGHCRAFDANARGTVSGNGVGVVALKRLTDALEEGDHIFAIIKGSAINNDGALKVGYTAPSVDGQADVIRRALTMSEVAPDTIQYVEAHGTGTALGDPIEIAALTQAFRPHTEKNGFCAVGSVKTNVGHLDSAAGVTGLIKTVLALQHRELPPSLHFERPNPEIDFAGTPFYVNNKLQPWKSNGAPRRAGVSSFGMGGTNAHFILEEAPIPEPSGKSRPWQLLLLSAKSEKALDASTDNLFTHLKQHPDHNFADVAFTLQMGRKDFEHRRMLVCRDAADAVSVTESEDTKRIVTASHEPVERPIAFMFPGQGAQSVNMAKELYQSEPVFREKIDRCCDLLQPHLNLDLRDLLYPADGDLDKAGERLQQTRITQPALFAIEYALAQLWISWGVRPQAMIGHSIGEYVAACLAGVFSLEDALKLVAVRGELMQKMPAGEMLAVPKAAEDIEPFLDGKLSLAAINDPGMCVVSGSTEAVKELEDKLNEKGESCKRLHTSHAFHSPMMDPILDAFAEEVKGTKRSAPTIPFISNVTGTWIEAAQVTDPAYWARHLRETVRFAPGVEELLREPNRILLEVGPGRTLSSLAGRHPEKTKEHIIVASLPHAREVQSDVASLLSGLGQLWLAGVEVDWNGFYANERRHRLPLPTYPFELQRYWVEPNRESQRQQIATGKHTDISKWFYTPSWKRSALPEGPASELLDKKDAWMVFSDERGLGAAVVEHLRQHGQQVVTVNAGDQFARSGADAFTINPTQKDDYDALFSEVLAEQSSPDHIIHLWSVTEDLGTGSEAFARYQERGYYSLLYLAQSLGEQGLTDKLYLAVVSNDLHEVTGEETISPEKSTLVGPCTVIPQEYSNISCCQIDVMLPENHTSDMTTLTQRLIPEFVTNPSANRIVAYRGRHRWTRSFEPVHLHHKDTTMPLRTEGTYLITGGLGAVGLVLSDYLARTVQAKLVLTGRIDPAIRSELSQWLLRNDERNGQHKHSQEATGSSVQFELDRQIAYINELEEQTSRELAIKGINGYAGLEQKLNQLCASYLYQYIQSSGIDTGRGKTWDRDELRKALGILPKFERLYQFILQVLAEDEIIRAENRSIEFIKAPDEVVEPAVLDRQVRESHPEFEGIYGFLEHCMESYDQALTGEIEGVSVLFPGGSAELLINYHAKNREEPTNERVQIEALKRLLTSVIQESGGKKVRILEVGAGNGVLTWSLVPALKELNVEYHFTDLVKSFVQGAEREAANRGLDFMRFGAYDITKDPEAQGFEKYSFDIILALNVVHATRSIEESVENLQTLLAPNGLMCFIEPVKSRRWMEMTWGLAKDWWAFEDTHLREITPLLEMDKWEEVLRSRGLQKVSTFPQTEQERENADSGLIVTQQDVDITTQDYRDWRAAANQMKKEQGQRIRQKLQAMEKLGARILIDDADVAQPAEMRTLIDNIYERFGNLNGVIHLAGVTDPDTFLPIPDSGETDAEAHFQPKVYGAYVLEEVLRDRNLDFCLLFSSLAAILGGLGLNAYSAANAFMDYFVQKINRTSRFPWRSANWDGWGVREARDDSAFGMSLTEYVMTPEEGLEAFQRALAANALDQVLVSTGDMQPRIARWLDLEFLDDEEQGRVDSDSAVERPDLPNDYVAPTTKAEETIAGIWRSLFGIEQIGVHDDFFQLGGHSLLATQFLNELRKYYKSGLSFRSLFENPTIADLAKLVEGDSDEQEGGAEIAVKERLLEATPEERRGIVEEYLATQTAQLLGSSVEEVKRNGKLSASELSEIAGPLLWNLKCDLHLPISRHLIMNHVSIAEMAQGIVDELAHLAKLHKMESTVSLSDSDGHRSKKRRERKKHLHESALPEIERTQRDSEQMLPNLDQLSDEEVEELLNKMMPDKEED